jgi:hypothetical protein
MNLTTPIAIVLAALVLALVGLFLFRYEVAPGNAPAYVTRLNRITGTISYCRLIGSPTEYQCP